jgi:hypothetical protein
LSTLDGLSENAALRIEVARSSRTPDSRDAARCSQSGFQTPIEWEKDGKLPDRVRLRVIFEGRNAPTSA